jgi:dTDP-4-amino-4,6-dideoxy-D-galactose acyltransferase
MSAVSSCRLLEWDSAFFGRKIASAGDRPLDRGAMERVIDWCGEQSIDCVYLLVEASDVATTRLCAENEFRLVDIRVTYDLGIAQSDAAAPNAAIERDVEERSESMSDPMRRSTNARRTTDTRPSHASSDRLAKIRTSRDSDIPALRAIAAKSHVDSRFYADGRFDRARCDELYATWIEKSCRGWADVVFVAEHDGSPAGYLSCHAREAKRGEIGLVGIDERAQGRGLGRALVDAALRWFAERKLERASVVTQGRNVPAQRLYQSAGFRTSAVQLWHHRWFTHSGSERP